MIGAPPHLADDCRDKLRQTLTAEFDRAVEPAPTIVGELPIGVLETGRHGYGIVRPMCTFAIAGRVERRQNITGKLRRLFHDGIDDIGSRFLVAG